MCTGIPTVERRRERTEKEDGRLYEIENDGEWDGMGRHGGGQISRYELGIFCMHCCNHGINLFALSVYRLLF